MLCRSITAVGKLVATLRQSYAVDDEGAFVVLGEASLGGSSYEVGGIEDLFSGNDIVVDDRFFISAL